MENASAFTGQGYRYYASHGCRAHKKPGRRSFENCFRLFPILGILAKIAGDNDGVRLPALIISAL
jgi:hypothetical protein